MRRAEWRVRADDPKTLLGWWWRGIVQEDRLMGLRLFGLVFSMGAMFTGASWALLPLAASTVLAKVLTRGGRPTRLEELLPDPAPERQFRVCADYRREGMATGNDRLAITLVDGWLVGDGVRSNFAVRPQDVQRLRTFSDRTATLALVDGSEVRLSGLRSEGRVALERWQLPEGSVEGVPTFPPARVHPQTFAYWGVYVVAGPALALIAWFVPWARSGSLLSEFIRNGGGYCGVSLFLVGAHFLLNLKMRDRSARREIVREPVGSLRLPTSLVDDFDEGKPVQVRA